MITEEVVDSICQWMHSGFSIDNSVLIEADDQVGLQRLTGYIIRCPFSLARMIKVTEDGKVIYRTGKSTCLRFPEHGDEQLKAGTLRNFQVFDPLEFLAEVTQHIPEKVLHLDVDILISEIFKVDYSAFLCDMRKIKIPIIF
jgi:hypothetical protein